MTKKLINIALALILILSVSGCEEGSKLTDKEQMEQDLNKYLLGQRMILKSESVGKLEIDEQTVSQDKTKYEVICNVEVADKK